MSVADAIFEPLELPQPRRSRTGIFRSNIAGRFDDYDGAGTQTRINWELKFARGGVGAIVSSWCGVDRARPDRPELRRRSTATSASRSGASSASACTSTTAATSSSSPTAAGSATSRGSSIGKGLSLDGQARSAARLPVRARDAGRSCEEIKRSFAAARAAGARGRARRGRDPRRERLHLHAVPLLGDQRPRRRVRRLAREPRALPARDGARRSAARSATTSTSR